MDFIVRKLGRLRDPDPKLEIQPIVPGHVDTPVLGLGICWVRGRALRIKRRDLRRKTWGHQVYSEAACYGFNLKCPHMRMF